MKSKIRRIEKNDVLNESVKNIVDKITLMGAAGILSYVGLKESNNNDLPTILQNITKGLSLCGLLAEPLILFDLRSELFKLATKNQVVSNDDVNKRR